MFFFVFFCVGHAYVCNETSSSTKNSGSSMNMKAGTEIKVPECRGQPPTFALSDLLIPAKNGLFYQDKLSKFRPKNVRYNKMQMLGGNMMRSSSTNFSRVGLE